MQRIKLALRVLTLAVLVMQGQVVADGLLRPVQNNTSLFTDYIAPAATYGNSFLNKIHALPTTEKVGGAVVVTGLIVWLTHDKIARKWNATAEQRKELGKVLAHCKDFFTGNLYAPHQAWLKGGGAYWRQQCDDGETNRQRDLKQAGQWQQERDTFEGQLKNVSAEIDQLKRERDQWKSNCGTVVQNHVALKETTQNVAEDNVHLDREADSYKKKLEAAEDELQRVQLRNIELGKEKNALEQVFSPLRLPGEEWSDAAKRWRRLMKEDEQNREYISNLDFQLNSLIQVNASSQQERARLEAELAQLQAASLAVAMSDLAHDQRLREIFSSANSLGAQNSVSMSTPAQTLPPLTPPADLSATNVEEQDSLGVSTVEPETLSTSFSIDNLWTSEKLNLQSSSSQTLDVETPGTVAAVVTSQSSSSSSTQNQTSEKSPDNKGKGQQQTNSKNQKKKK